MLLPAAIQENIHKYQLPYHQTTEQLLSSCETQELILNTPPWTVHFSDLIIIYQL